MAQRSGKKTKTAKAEDAIIETVVENTAEAEKKNIVEAAENTDTVNKKTKEVIPVKPAVVITPTMEVEVASNKAGTLIYVSKKTSEKFEWNAIGDTNWMTIEELATMRNTQRAFFENNWVKVVDENADDIIRHLRLVKYYENFIDLSELEDIVQMEASDIIALVSPMNKEIKDNLASGAKGMIESGYLNNLGTIRALEKAIGYSLLDND